MKIRLQLTLTFLLGILLFGCNKDSSKGNSEGSDSTTASSPNVSNKQRPDKKIARVLTLRIGEPDSDGFLYSQTDYDKMGNPIEIRTWPRGLTEPEDAPTTMEYDKRGNMVKKTVAGDFYEYEYDADDRLIKESVDKMDFFQTEEYSYDAKGNVLKIVVKQKSAGKKDEWSRNFKYEYDADGNIIEEWKWEEYSDVPGSVEMYHKKREYVDGRMVKETDVDPHGVLYYVKEFEYDARGNLIKEFEFERNSDFAADRVEYDVNEYGEVTEERNFSCQSETDCRQWSTSETRYDSLGTMIYTFLTQEHGQNFGEKYEITYW